MHRGKIEHKPKEENDMKGSNGTRISALLMAMLLVGMAFVPAVGANAEKAEIEKRLKDVKIDWITDKEDEKEYYATVLADDKEQKFFVKQWQEEVDGKKVWKFNVFEVQPDGVIAKDVSFGKDSYYWTDDSGLHMHFGPKDKALIIAGGSAAIAFIVAVITIVCPPAGAYAAAFVAALAIVIIAVDYAESNPDGSIDVFISWASLALIPVYAVLPGLQNIKVKIGSHYYNVPI